MSHSGAPLPGTQLASGKYVVEKVIGEGGMGVVLAAREEQLGRRVAIKLLHATVSQKSDAAARFKREARAAARLTSEHAIRLYEIGQLDDGAPYMAMELLEGDDLQQVMEARGKLAPELLTSWLLDACEALAEAHAAGIIHRDLKPSNLFLAKRVDGSVCVKVLDFGISKSTADIAVQGSLTGSSQIMGSPYYMSPEQMRSARNVGITTDIWALGIILYEGLTGVRPFQAETLTELICAVTTGEDPAPITELVADLPRSLERVVERCLKREPSQRFQNLAELSVALQEFAPERAAAVARIQRTLAAALGADTVPTIASPAGAAKANSQLPLVTADSWAASSPVLRSQPSRRRLAFALAAAAVVGATTSIFYARSPPDPLVTAGSEPPAGAVAAPSHSQSARVTPAPASAATQTHTLSVEDLPVEPRASAVAPRSAPPKPGNAPAKKNSDAPAKASPAASSSQTAKRPDLGF